MLSALRYRDFRLLWASTFCASTAQFMQRLVVGWLALKLTGSATFLGATFAARSAPNLILGAFSGAAADRLNRKHLLMGVQGAAVVLHLTMAALVLSGAIGPWSVLLLTFAYGAVQTFDTPARQATVYDIAGREVLMNAVSLNAVGSRAMSMVGPLVGGLLIEALGIGHTFLVMATVASLGVLVLSALQLRQAVRPARHEAVLANIVTGVKVIGGNPAIAALLAMAVGCEVFAFSYQSVMPLFAEQVLAVGASGYGYLTSAVGLGALLGVIALASLGNFPRKGWLLLGAFLLFGLFLVAFSCSSWFSLSLLILVGVGMMAATFDTLEHTLLQTNVPHGMQGRAMGAWVLSLGVGPVGMLYVGMMADRIGAPQAVAINGIVVGAIALAAALTFPRVRAL